MKVFSLFSLETDDQSRMTHNLNNRKIDDVPKISPEKFKLFNMSDRGREKEKEKEKR